MTLEQLTTPFEERRVYAYASDGNKVVRRTVKVQQVKDALYRGETEDVNGWKECALYAFIPGVPDGINLTSRIYNTELPLTPDGMPQNISVWGTKEEWLRMLDAHMEHGGFIGMREIAFIRQFSPEKAEEYTTYRMAYYERRTAEEDTKQEEGAEQIRTEEEADKALQQANLDAAKAKYYGWADNMTPLRFGKVRVNMEGLIQVNGKIMQKRNFIVSMVKDGWKPEKREGVTSWYGSKWEPKQSKPRTEHCLVRGNYSYKISKTEYDFALYLTEHKEFRERG